MVNASMCCSVCVSNPGCTWCTRRGVPDTTGAGSSPRHHPYCTGQEPCEDIVPEEVLPEGSDDATRGKSAKGGDGVTNGLEQTSRERGK